MPPGESTPRRRPASLKVRALQWLAQREHSPTELREKLLRVALTPRQGSALPSGAPDDADAAPPAAEKASPDASPEAAAAEVDALIGWLGAHGHLSTQRFVDSRVHQRQARFGQQRIAQELRRHGVDREAGAVEALAALKATEFERARALWLKKFGSPALDAPGRLKQMRFLAGRGFSHEVVRRIVRASPTDDEV